MKNLILIPILLISFIVAQGAPKPVPVASFGPNGTHWPNLIPTPFIYDETVPHQIEVDANWNAIEIALKAVTDQQANEGVLILVRPGVLEGDGTSSSSDAMLDDIGSTSWGKRITICPRDGYGTVSMNRTRVQYLKNICIAGFICEGGMRYVGCEQSALAWMQFETGWLGTYSDDDIVSSDIEFVEVVVQNQRASNGDTTQIAASGGEVVNWTWEGCYYAPVYIPLPKEGSPHSDTMQFFNNGDGIYRNITFKDCAFFASDNTAIQTGLVDGLILDHTILLAGDLVYDYYPVPTNGENDSTKTLNGSGRNFQAIDSIIIGSMGLNDQAGASQIFTNVTNTQVSYQPTGILAPISGEWTVNNSLDANIEGYPSFPTNEYLQGIWSKKTELIRVASFGPNGTHWPSLIPTPFMYDKTVPHQIEVDTNWNAIRNAIESVTGEQASEGVLILVKPGDLVGNGTSGANPLTLLDIGSSEWLKRVTVAPRDGYGSVHMTNGARLRRVQGVCFAGFEISGGLVLDGCKHSSLAWCKMNGWFASYGNALLTTDKLEFSEIVQPDHYISNADSADFFTNNGDIENWIFDGCYHAPRFFIDGEYTSGNKPHTDTIQFARSGSGNYSNMTIRDSAYFSSNNCAIQTGSLDGMLVEHSYVVSGSVSLSRYPHLLGGSTEATVNAFNGSGDNFRAKDSIFIGGMALNSTKPHWTSVENTRIDREYITALNPTEGSWTVDESLQTDLSSMPPYPTDDYLSSIWSDNGVIVNPDPDVDDPTIPQGIVSQSSGSYSVNLSWTASTDNVAVTGYRIFQNGNFLKAVTTNFTEVSGLSAETTYTFTVSAIDAAGNESTQSVATSVTTSPAVSLDEFLVAHWPVVEDSGNMISELVSGKTGVLEGTPILNGGSISFDTNDDRVQVVPFDVSGSAITIAAWVQPHSFEGLASEARFVSKASGTNAEDHYWMLGNYGDGSAVRFRLKVDGTTHTLVSSNGLLQLNQKHHIAATYDGTTMRLFVDGVEGASLVIPGGGELSVSPLVAIGLGNQPNGSGDRPLLGELDDIRIYSVALQASELLSIINLPLATNYNDWLAENGLSSELSDFDDSDKDGIPLLIEYAFGTDPKAYSLNLVILEADGDGSKVTYPAIRSELTYLVQTSTDLYTWGNDWVDQETGDLESPPSGTIFVRVMVSR